MSDSRKNKNALFLVLLACSLSMQAQQVVETPRLVVSIVVDQLRGDYLQYFRSTFGEKGFQRLSNGGLVYYSVDFDFPNRSEASSIAAIYTGSYPYYNGITGDKKYDVSKSREISIVTDNNYMGNYTSDRFSPLPLLASTVGDELKIASNGRSLVYALAPNAAGAILSGGQYANGAFWLDDYNGKWATSTYYKDAPSYVERYNATEAIGNSPEKQWTQSYTWFAGLPYSTRKEAFSYKFTKSDNERFMKIKQTALINTEVTNLAVRFLEYAGFGNHACSDMLAITYYAGNYNAGPQPEEYSYEIQDIYSRLDQELERLLDAIDRRVGLKHTVVVLTSTGYYDTVNRLPQGFQPSGEFYPNRCTALLNMYLMAIYGPGDWVSAYYDRQIFLNKKLAEEKQIAWSELVRNAAEFVSQFSGVQGVTTAGQWLVDDTGRAAAFRRGMHKQVSGDIFIELQPGWAILNENTTKKEPVRDNAIIAPLFISGEYIRKEHIYRTVKASAIAPTLSYLLRIRTPNACRDLPLPEVVR
ncbi:MAG: alkaline phosphatase family protein [Dysgonamonadaceae bacterium]|nr:alkaline phosphatase family protein [Dysgonamonadaceae bacterium]